MVAGIWKYGCGWETAGVDDAIVSGTIGEISVGGSRGDIRRNICGNFCGVYGESSKVIVMSVLLVVRSREGVWVVVSHCHCNARRRRIGD